jgi:diguanylate cyclase
LRTLESGLELLPERETALEAELLRWSAWVCVDLGRHAEALVLAERSAAAARRAGDPGALSNALSVCGAATMAAAEAGEPGATLAAAEEYLRAAVDEARRASSVSAYQLARGNLAIAAAQAGRVEEAAAVFSELLELFDRAGDETAAIEAIAQLAALRRRVGDDHGAAALLANACRRARIAGDHTHLCLALAELADIAASAEDWATAYRHLAEARRLDAKTTHASARRAGQLLAVRVSVEESQRELTRLRDRASGLENLVAELDAQRAHLAQAALIDPLTGLANRRAADRAVQSASNSRRRCGVIIVDIDRFKAVNDRFGHPIGDAVLRRVGLVIAGCVRERDLAARYGGEEFLCLLTSDPRGARAVAERIRRTVAELELAAIAPGLGQVTISAGVAEGEAATLKRMLALADQRMYIAKRRGRNRIVAVD